ncbi:hypothetical protein BH10PSE1_BH10PSE1_30060 [soil metagenome]
MNQDPAQPSPKGDVHCPHPVDIHVGLRVKARRVSLGYNQTDLGRALGLTFQQIQKYEKGANRVSASKLWDTAQFLKVDIDYFFIGLPDFESRPAPAGSHNHPSSTGESLEITRLAPQLSIAQQKLALGLIRELAGSAI